MSQKRKEKLVFKSDWHRIYQWRQRLYDGSYATFERFERPTVVLILPVSGRKIIMALEEQPTFKRIKGLIGGVVEKGEKPLTAAKRELIEETGMVAHTWKLVGKYKYSGRISYTLYLFAALGAKKVTEQHLDPGERIKVISTTLPQLLSSIERIRLDDKVKIDMLKARYEPRRRRELEKALGLSG